MTVWARVRSVTTGHHFDVALPSLDRLLRRSAVEELPGRRIRAASPRPPKYLVDLSGRRVAPASRPDNPKEQR